MDKRKDREHREDERHGHEGHEHDRPEHERPRQRGTGYGKERPSYLALLARRWLGSVPPTPEAYARALQQWRQLQGSIVTAPADLGSDRGSAPVSDSKPLLSKSPRDTGDKDRG
jgi:hypothetical protein